MEGLVKHKTWLGLTKIAWWSLIGTFFISIVGIILYFSFDLSGHSKIFTFFGAVNESVWESLKLFFWAGLLWALIEYTYLKDDANNFWFAKAVSFVITALVISLSFYAYIFILGSGILEVDIAICVLGVTAGQIFASKTMQRNALRPSLLRWTPALLGLLIVMFSTFTYFPPKIFLFEDFAGYEFSGLYGIVDEH